MVLITRRIITSCKDPPQEAQLGRRGHLVTPRPVLVGPRLVLVIDQRLVWRGQAMSSHVALEADPRQGEGLRLGQGKAQAHVHQLPNFPGCSCEILAVGETRIIPDPDNRSLSTSEPPSLA